MYIWVNSTFQRCPNKIIKIFLIEDFSHLPLVSTTPVVNLELRISPRFFERIWNGPYGILWGWGETDWWKKPEAKNLVPLSTYIFMLIYNFVTLMSDQDPDPHESALVWLPGSRSGLKPMRIHYTTYHSSRGQTQGNTVFLRSLDNTCRPVEPQFICLTVSKQRRVLARMKSHINVCRWGRPIFWRTTIMTWWMRPTTITRTWEEMSATRLHADSIPQEKKTEWYKKKWTASKNVRSLEFIQIIINSKRKFLTSPQ